MTNPDIRTRLIKCVAKSLGKEERDIASVIGSSGDSHFSRDLGLDSLDMAELVMEIEIEFHIDIPDAVFSGLETFAALEQYVASIVAPPAEEAAPTS